MKKLFYILILLPAILVGCSSDDAWEDATIDDLIGRWQLTDAYTKKVNTNNPEITKELHSISINTTPMEEFKAGGVYINGYGDEGRYYFEDNNIYISYGGRDVAVYENVRMRGDAMEFDMDIAEDNTSLKTTIIIRLSVK